MGRYSRRMTDAEMKLKAINTVVGRLLDNYLKSNGAVILSPSQSVSTWISQFRQTLDPDQVSRVVRANRRQHLVVASWTVWDDRLGITVQISTYLSGDRQLPP